MSTLKEIVSLGKEMGYEGDDLRDFVEKERLIRERALAREREMEREEREREREEREREREERAVEREIRKQQLEVERLKLQMQGNEKDSSLCKPSLPKLPVFNDITDSIDAYILRFERLAVSAGWSKDIWAVSLASLLQGKALETYQHLSPVEAKDFDSVKEALLRCFQCTSEGYRLRFRNCKFFKNETAQQFGNRLKNNLKRWVELADCEETFDDLFDLMLIEQFLNACDKDMVVFLKEHEMKTFDQVVKYAEMYMEAHLNYGKKSLSGGHEKHGASASKVTTGDSKWQTDADSDRKVTARNCYVCGRGNHLAKDCFERFGGPKRKGASKGATEKAAVVGHGGKLMVDKGTVEGVEVNVFRDPGCTTVLVKRALVPKHKFTGKHVDLKMANNQVFRYPEAIVDVVSPYFTGETLAACMPDPIYDLVIGAIDGSTDGLSTEVSAVTTRLQNQMQEKKLKGPSKLKVKEVINLMQKENIGKLQAEDGTLKKVFEHAKSNRVFVKNENKSHCFVVKKGILYCRVQNEGIINDQLVVPDKFRHAVIELAHDSLMSGHLGIQKTTARIQSNFYWPGMSVQITRFCRSCDACQRTVDKGRVKKVKLGRMPLIQEPFQRVAVDIVGPIEPRASDGSRYILTIVDYATRYPEAVALKNIDSVTVAEALLSVFSRVGIPKEVLSDRGTQFTSEVMREFNRLLSIKSITTTPYHAMCNGLVEKFNGVLKKMLRRMCTEQPKMWPRYIDPLLFAYREVPQSSTKFSPFELVYGHTVRGPLSLLRELWENEDNAIEDSTRTTYEYVVDMRERLQDTCRLAQEELERARDKYQCYYDKNACKREINEGDKVLLLLPTSNNKLLVQWQGPFEVVKKVNRYNFVLNINGVERKYHINMLKLYYDRISEGNNVKGKFVEAEGSGDLKSGAVLFTDDQESDDLACVAVVSEDSDEYEVTVVPSDIQSEDVSNVKINQELSEDKKEELARILQEYKNVFTDVPGRTNVIEHVINLSSKGPVRCRPYPVPYALQQDIDREIERMLKLGVIECSNSPYATPLIVVKKKDGSNRMCLDFRKINKLTVFDSEPMPDQNLIMTRVSKSRYFTKIDLSKGYWQIPLEKESREVTAFQTNRGLLQFTTMPFGLVNAGATFNRMMRKLFNGVKNVELFVDDILIHSQGWEEHKETLRLVLDILRKAFLTAKPSKTEIGCFSVEYLGSKIGNGISRTAEDKVSKVLNVDTPKTKREVKSFLGLTGYYRHYIPDYATIAAPLTDLIKKSQPNVVNWSLCHQESFEKLKNILSSHPIVKLPDLTKDFVLQVDASNVGLGAILMQYVDGERWPVQYASRKLKGAEQNYSVIEKECLAVVWAVKKFYQYLYGKAFVIESDHQPLKYLNSAGHINSRLMRWAMYLQQFEYTIHNIPGKENVGPDCLSRL
ncbi:uncharacterized protein [Palaemon carinicauda]|uniref:uncharacterized protein n=1 Tax=Palaemon carinicauda TaxID=392227 RepID=UPI0035B63308